MSAADHGETDRAILTLQATVKDIAARLALVEARVDTLENPESDPARSLAALADRIDAATPGKVPGNEVEKLESRESVTVN